MNSTISLKHDPEQLKKKPLSKNSHTASDFLAPHIPNAATPPGLHSSLLSQLIPIPQVPQGTGLD